MKWPLVPFATALERIEAGQSPKALDRPALATEFGVLKLSAISWGDFEPTENKALLPNAPLKDCPRVCAGDLLMSRANTTELVGAVVLVGQDHQNLFLSDKTLRLVPNKKVALAPFLLYALRTRSARNHIEQNATGTSFSMRNISQEKIALTPIPLPPLREQQRIVEVLDLTEALRAKRRAALAKLDTLTQAIFLDMFGDPASNPKGFRRATVDDVSDQVTDGEHLTPQRTTKGIKLLSARNVRDGYIDFKNVDYISDAEFERIKRRCNPSEGDILISCSGTIGRVASVETSEPFSLVRSVALVRPASSMIRTKYLEHLLRTPTMKARMLSRANASSQANLFQGQIRELPVSVPPTPLQDSFVRRVGKIDALKGIQHVSLAGLDALFASLQHRAFRGEL